MTLQGESECLNDNSEADLRLLRRWHVAGGIYERCPVMILSICSLVTLG